MLHLSCNSAKGYVSVRRNEASSVNCAVNRVDESEVPKGGR
jgi:hypothetical protein